MRGRMTRPILIAAAMMAATLLAGTGCMNPNRSDWIFRGNERRGKTFYLGGAGNFGLGKDSVPRGLADAGYRGDVEHFVWTSYMGPLVDQMYLQHNRRVARALARRIQDYLRQHPNRKVNLIALSAGTGVAVFALEELEKEFQVETVVLLSSSLSADYDLSRALRRVNGDIYFFWSPKDPILSGLVPIVGTVDRAGFGARPAGTHGAMLAAHASNETKDLYRNVKNVQWHPEASNHMLRFGHSDIISRSTVRELVAPLLVMPSGPPADLLFDQPSAEPAPAPTRHRLPSGSGASNASSRYDLGG